MRLRSGGRLSNHIEATKDRVRTAEPRNHAECTVRFEEDGYIGEFLFKLSLNADEKEDENIFFFCNGLSGLKALLKEDNGENFVVLDYSLKE